MKLSGVNTRQCMCDSSIVKILECESDQDSILIEVYTYPKMYGLINNTIQWNLH